MKELKVNQPKKHFEILDGLRGIAALAVVIFHFMEWVYLPDKNFIGHGFLAVDFFFCLSGFVIGYAYDDRIGNMGLGTFFKARLIRLHPLVIFGSILGILEILIDPLFQTYSLSKITLIFLSSVLLIPYPVMEERLFNLFSFNAPSWSLFWEYIANVFYALFLFKISRRFLTFLIIPAAMGIIWISFDAGNLMGGWSKDTFFHGGIRVSFSFLMGLLIYRMNWIIKNNLGFVTLSILLFLAFIMPVNKLNWLMESLVVLIYFPLIVALGAGSNLSPKLKKVCNFSGNISYPLYMTHYAFIWIFGNYFTTQKPPASELHLVMFVGTILLVIFAYLVMKFYDIPLRRYLTNKWRK